MCRSSDILLPTPGTVNRLLGSLIFLATIVHLFIFPQLPGMLPNVRRYGSVALYRGGTCFCRHTVVQGYTLWLQNYRVGKNRDAMSGSPAGGGGGLCRRLRNCPFSQGVVAAQKAMTYTALLGIGGLILFIGLVYWTLLMYCNMLFSRWLKSSGYRYAVNNLDMN